MAADMGFYEAEQFIDKLNAQKHMSLIVNSKVGDRATVKAYLISMGAPINLDDPQCDVYSIGSAWNDAYKISTVKVCYPGDGTIQPEFILGEAIENIELSYLKSLYPTATFSMPRAEYIKPPKSTPVTDFMPTGADLGLNSDNKSDNNTIINDNMTLSQDNASNRNVDEKQNNKKDKKK